MMRMMLMDMGQDWLSTLGLIVAHHNQAVHSATGMRPVQLHYNSESPVNPFMQEFEEQMLLE